MKKTPKDASELLDIYYLEMRSSLLECAAAMDRIERAVNGSGTMTKDPRTKDLIDAARIIAEVEGSRAETILKMLSKGD